MNGFKKYVINACLDTFKIKLKGKENSLYSAIGISGAWNISLAISLKSNIIYTAWTSKGVPWKISQKMV